MRKALILSIILTVAALFVPEAAKAFVHKTNEVGNSNLDPQVRVQVRRGRRGKRKHSDNGRHLGWYKGKRAYIYYYNPYQTGYVRYPYYRSGRRSYMWVRFY